MTVLIIGATGRTGKWLVKTALDHGHQLNCLVRNAASFRQHAGINVFQGSPLTKLP